MPRVTGAGCPVQSKDRKKFSVSDHPLVTFSLATYNQEAYIREAVEGAFAQTYTPLEVILSDDGSTDRTFEIMQEMVAAYTGPHTVILNRNEPNLGIIAHVNKLFAMTHGELFVGAAGDDVSAANRVETVVDAWLKHDRKPKMIASSYEQIDVKGKTLRRVMLKSGIDTRSDADFYENLPLPYIGAVNAFSSDLARLFGPILAGSVDDHIYVGRARFLGDVLSLPDVLVRYRVGCGMSTNKTDFFRMMLKSYQGAYHSAVQLVHELQIAANHMSETRRLELEQVLLAKQNKLQNVIGMWSADAFARRFGCFVRLGHIRLLRKPKSFLVAVLTLLPQPVSSVVINALVRLNR